MLLATLVTILLTTLLSFILPALAVIAPPGCMPAEGAQVANLAHDVGPPCQCTEGFGPGVSRLVMDKAITYACDGFTQLEFTPNTMRSMTYAHYHDDGVVYVFLGYHAWQTGLEYECASDMPISYDFWTCAKAFMVPMDACDTDTVTAKQGGYTVDKCMAFQVDPNPAINQPGSPVPPPENPWYATYGAGWES